MLYKSTNCCLNSGVDKLRKTAYQPIDKLHRITQPHIRQWRRRRNLKNLKKDFQLNERRSKIKRQDEKSIPSSRRGRVESRGRDETKSRQKKKKRRST